MKPRCPRCNREGQPIGDLWRCPVCADFFSDRNVPSELVPVNEDGLPGHFKRMSGERHGRLLVVSLAAYKLTPSGKRTYIWFCVCDCGVPCLVRGDTIRSGNSASCGCLGREHVFTHGMSYFPEYRIWLGIKSRTTNERRREHKDYGGRGIKMCERWLHSFENFYSDMGPRPSAKHSVERKNNDGDYSPDNCVWATRTQQNNNSRRNVPITHNGMTMTASEWSRLLGIHRYTIVYRLRLGWTVEEALTTPVRPRHTRIKPSQSKEVA